MYFLPRQSSPSLLMPASELLADTTGEALGFLEERVKNVRQATLVPSADGASAQQEVRQQAQRRLVSVFDAAERILVLARIAQQRKT
jgi:hypothetical protein